MACYYFINQYASTPLEGAGGRYYYFAKALQERGNKVVLVASSNHHLLRNKPKFWGLWSFSNYNGLDVLWLKTLSYSKANSPIRVLNWFLFCLYLPFLGLLRFRPDQVHFSSPSPIPFLGAWVLAKLSKAVSVFDVRDVWPETFIEIGGISRTNLFVRFLYAVELFCFKRSTVVTSNLANLDIRFKELGVDSKKFFWIPNGIDISGVNFSLQNSTISLPFQCNGKKIIGYTGTLGEANALFTMLDAAKILMDKPEYVFLIVGNGKEKAGLVDYCHSNSLSNVVFMDSVSKADIYSIQSKMDVLCVGAKTLALYRYGVSPNKLYEYMYSGIPIIYYIDTPYYNPVVDAGCGVEIKSNDVFEFAAAIEKLSYLTQGQRDAMKAKSRKYIAANHIYENISTRLVDVVNKYVGKI